MLVVFTLSRRRFSVLDRSRPTNFIRSRAVSKKEYGIMHTFSY